MKNIEIIKCKNCQKEFESEKRFHRKFCCHKCAIQFNNRNKGPLSKENKQKISKKMKEKWENGEIRKEQLNNWIKSGQEASSKKMKGKTYEEIYGDKEAKKKREHYSELNAGKNNPFYGKHHTIESKKKIVENRKKEGYIYPSGKFNGIIWQGSYELAYLIWCYENNVCIKRYDLDPVEYYYQGDKHHYYPDFIINDNIVVECKGYKDGKHKFKIAASKKIFNKYILIEEKQIKNDLGFNIPDNSKEWILEQKEKYSDLIEITHFPWERIIENKS